MHRLAALSGGQDLRPLWFCPKGLQKDALLFKNALLGPAAISLTPHRPEAPRRTAMTAQTALPSQPFRVATLASRKPTRFAFRPEAADRALIAAALGLLDLPALEMVGEIRPEGRRDLRLEARLTAQAVQACSVTLGPVPARVEEPVLRRYLAEYEAPRGDEVEITEDESEPLPDVIDVAAVAVEALALALPAWPRAPGAELGEAVFTEPGVAPLRQADLNPFAGLAGLAERLKNGDGTAE